MNLTQHYLSIPKKLITELRDNGLAIALYFFVARLYLVAQQCIPLSRGDIQKFDPSAKTGAIKRALDRLIQAGWLIETTGHKSSYVPTWGESRSGVPYPWQIGPARLGRPAHVTTLRIDRALLDLFMGKFTPHMRNAHIESYFTRPLLGLHDIGTYILIAAELETEATEALQRWDLVRDGQAQDVPDEAVVLALASQRASLNGFQLTEAGWHKLGWFRSRSSQPAAQEGVAAVPLIFVPKERIGQLIPQSIGESIGCSTSGEGPASASERQETDIDTASPTMPGRSSDSQEPRDLPPNPPTHPQRGGGLIFSEEKSSQEIERADTEATHALFAFGVNDPDCIVELATMPIEQVGGAIAYAESEDLGPGWVVTALRRRRDEGWPIPKVRKRQSSEPIDWEVVAAQQGDLFRRGSDLTGLDWSTVDAALNLQQPDGCAGGHGPPPQLAVGRSATELTHELRSRLLVQCDRCHRRLISNLQMRVAANTTVIHCASLADRLTVLDELLGALRWVIADLGLPSTLRVTDRPPPTEPEQLGTGGQPASGFSRTA